MEVGVFVVIRNALRESPLPSMMRPLKLFSKENFYALLFCLMLIALILLTADTAPVWIYQGF